MGYVEYDPDARDAIQGVYDDDSMDQLAERLEELLELLETDPKDHRLTRRRMHRPGYWLVPVYGSGRDFAFMWDLGLGGQPYVRWAGDY